MAHSLSNSYSLKGFLTERKRKGCEILFQGVVNINELLFPKHHDKGKDQLIIASYGEMDVKGDVAVQPEG